MKIKNIKVKNKKVLSMILALGFSMMPISNVFNESDNMEYRMVSIFNDDNIESNQYGANQNVFIRDFDSLINDPYIWNILQKYFPQESFSSKEKAMCFYRSYFRIIYDNGCGYAVACDAVFHSFEGKEEEFEKCFGYPMYTIDENGVINYNYEIFILDFFSFSVIDMLDKKSDILKAMDKDLCEFDLDEYTYSEEFKRKKPDNMTESELEEWIEFDKARTDKFFSLYNRFIDATNENINFGITLDATFGYLYIYLNKFYLICNISIDNPTEEFEVGDIIACERFELFIDEEGTKEKNMPSKIGSHYVYVTDITEDGIIIVSSWGKKYYFDNSGALWTDKVIIKVIKRSY